MVFKVNRNPNQPERYKRFHAFDIGIKTLDDFQSQFPEVMTDRSRLQSMVSYLNQRRQQAVGDQLVAQGVFAVAVYGQDSAPVQAKPVCFLFTLAITKEMVAPIVDVGPAWRDIVYMWMVQKLT